LAVSAWILSGSRAVPSLAKTAGVAAARASKVNVNRETLSNYLDAINNNGQW
jgi:hypothetical protein